MDVMDRDQTIDFLRSHVNTDMLMKHLLSVEASMRGYARKFGRTRTVGPSPGCSTTSIGRFVPRLWTTLPSAHRSSVPKAIPKT